MSSYKDWIVLNEPERGDQGLKMGDFPLGGASMKLEIGFFSRNSVRVGDMPWLTC